MNKEEKKALDGTKDATSPLKDKNAFAQQYLEAAKEEVFSLKRQLKSVQFEKRTIEGQVEKGAAQVENIMKENQGLQAQISELKIALKEREDGLKDNENESAARVADLTAQLKHIVQDVDALQLQKKELEEQIVRNKREESTQIRSLTEEVTALKQKLESLQNQKLEEEEGLEAKNIELRKVLAERHAECLALEGKLEEQAKEAFAQITHLTTQVSSLKEELDSLQTLKNQSEQQFEIHKEKFSENLKKTEGEKMELINKLLEQQKMLQERDDAFIKLMQENKQTEASLQDCQVRLQEAEKKMGLMAVQLHKRSGSEDSMKTYLEDIIEDLKRDLEVKKDEVHTLVENSRTIEVKLRLSNQKIRITEQLLTEKDESFKELEIRYQEEVAAFKERIANLHQALDIHQNMIRDISEHVDNKMTALETVVKKFYGKCEDYKRYILEVSNELQIAKNCVMQTRNEKEQLSQRVNQLTTQLEDEKDQHLLLKKRAEFWKAKSSNEDEETENVANVKDQLEKKIEDMEMNVFAIGEEKREAIRQLCMWVDYHQSRYDFLKEMMSRVTVRNQKTA